MKSMLNEASSVAKAVEKAWTDAGKPTEFSIKVLEVGEKNFIGFSKKPAVISITFDARKQTARSHEAGKNQERRTHEQNPKGNKQLKPQVENHTTQKLPIKKDAAKLVQQKHPKEVVKEKSTTDHVELTTWQDDMVAFVDAELKTLLALWGMNLAFAIKVDKKALMVTLDGHLHSDAAEERNVFMSFSYILVQLLKRHFKKKFRGFQLIINAQKNPV